MHFRKIGIRLGIYFRITGIKSGIHFENLVCFEASMACPCPKSGQVPPPRDVTCDLDNIAATVVFQFPPTFYNLFVIVCSVFLATKITICQFVLIFLSAAA